MHCPGCRKPVVAALPPPASSSHAAIKRRNAPKPQRKLPVWVIAGIFAVVAAVMVLVGVLVLRKSGQEAEFEKLRRAAETGNAEAQFRLGSAFDSGEEPDLKRALRWYRQAAEQGLPEAQMEVAGIYALGRGVDEDKNEALKWITRAAEQGYLPAQTTLGAAYTGVEGYPVDHEESFRWTLAAAEREDAKSQFIVGVLFLKGEGTPRSEFNGNLWIERSADQGFVPAVEFIEQRRSNAALRAWSERMWEQHGPSPAEFGNDPFGYRHPSTSYEPPQFREARERSQSRAR